jgi:isopentenyl phosphate kinase
MTTKLIVWFLLINGTAWTWCSYFLAYTGREEIAEARHAQSNLKIVLGHGSGSFGHVAGHQYGTRSGVTSAEGWLGFAKVWEAARALNQVVVEGLEQAGIPVIAFPPSAIFIADHGLPYSAETGALTRALDAGLVPLVNGDVVFDRQMGGTILSTEDVFFFLARQLKPQRILLAGIEEGVWVDYPKREQLLSAIDLRDLPSISAKLTGSGATDVTGGMLQKVRTMMELASQLPGLEILIFSGMQAGQVKMALSGGSPGTVIRSPADQEG